ncbi:MAG: sensor histidine kinase KdpD, partial [Candidatus Eremiobacteraeota bacterium]|nr:sensor histidine kinase KdpD [Candidatus Eremiobacteraeota bacterium]
MNQRPDPDELLAQLTVSQLHETHGSLKIYLGYAAGVGKTFAMLSAAHQQAANGVDVVVGLVETHGREETEALLEGLEVLPRARSEYRGVQLEEFNLDLALARSPQLILVDELAHTNQPGSRHPKRYQDVMELLEAGIDVYTTINVQHLESLHDIVKQITGVTVRETVPDHVLEQASQLVLVDIPPPELIDRLEQGKVYVPAQAERAVSNFFRPGNLSALRELGLREAARRVDEDVRTYMRHRSIPGPWPAGERLLVCVGPSPLSQRLVRAAKRLADVHDAPWVALHVATDHLSPAERERVTRHLELAARLGAEVTTLTGPSMVPEVADFVSRENITKIVAGKPLRRGWREVLRGTLVDRIMQQT